MKKVSLILVLLLAVFVVNAYATSLDDIKAKGSFSIGVDPKWEPFTFYDSKKNITGFDMDLISEVAKLWGVTIKPITKVWGDCIPGLVNREYDAWVGPITITAKRAKIIIFTSPHFNAGQMLMVKANNRSIKSIKDLGGKTVGAPRGSTCLEAAKSIRGTRKIIEVETIDEGANALLSGKIDALVMDRPVLLSYAKKAKGKFKVVGKPFTVEYYGYAVHKEDSELLMQLNEAIARLKDNGTYDAVVKKWFE